ncbi:carboxypeptidase-like regulatory domain-containing protein [Spirosoma soli]|uniref:Carboxypeptidase-like regulatory domain-containing protein n=2 Tax=Spirosoma soli TaxID=1770529 RepID=A0ABW5MAQ8_9BACT
MLFASISFVWGQSLPSTLTGVVTDTAGASLPFASVGLVNTTVGTVADENGRFSLYLTNGIRQTDTLRVSLIGYSALSLPVNVAVAKLAIKPVIVLTPLSIRLREVTVRSADWEVRQTGNNHVDTRMKTNFALSNKPRQNLGAEIGRVFRVPKQGAYLEEFRFYVSANNFDSTRFRINVYSLRRNYPSNSLLQRPVYIDLKKAQKGWITVDLRPYNVFAADDVAVSIEWVNYGGKGSYLGIPITMPSIGAVHLYKYGSQTRWKKFGQMSACMNLAMVCAPR